MGLFPDFEPGEQELWDVGVEATQTLYSGGKVRAGVVQLTAVAMVAIPTGILAASFVDVVEKRKQDRPPRPRP